MPSRFWKASGNALLPSSNVLAVSTVWTPASFGSNLAVWYDISDISTLFQDTAGTTPVTADGQTVKRINDKSGNGYNATYSTGWVYHANSGKPYLAMDNVAGFVSPSGTVFADANGQFSEWVVANLSNNGNNWLISGLFGNLLLANPALNRDQAYVNGSGGNINSDLKTGVSLNTSYVFSGICTGNGSSGTIEVFVDNVGDGSTAYTGTPVTSDTLHFGDTAGGQFYGAWIAKGDQSASRSNAQTYGAGLHP